MSWNIVYTAQARQDLRDIYEHIALSCLRRKLQSGKLGGL